MKPIIWQPQPGPQTHLLSCPIEDILFGGARGGGKTDALLGDFLKHQAQYANHGRGMLLRRSMPELEDVIRRSHEIYPPCGATWRATTKVWHFPSGGTLKMRFIDRDEDASFYQGHSYTWLGLDELGSWPDPAPIDKLRATLRSAAGVRCVMRATANPGGVGQQWIRERYMDGRVPMQPFYDEAKRTWRVFIPSRVRDNQIMLAADPGYIDRLRSSGPDWLVRAWLDGDWNASSSESFFSERVLLADGQPVELQSRCDMVYAVIDTALKDGMEHDGTAVVYYARNKIMGVPLVILDWDIIQIEGSLLDKWLVTVNQRLEELAAEHRAREGNRGMWIEDKASGTVLIQQGMRAGLPVAAIDGPLTAMGKEGRALNITSHVYQGKVKFSRHAYEKVAMYKGQTKNHLLSQVCGFRLGTRTPHGMDLFDCFTYGVAIGLGNSEGY